MDRPRDAIRDTPVVGPSEWRWPDLSRERDWLVTLDATASAALPAACDAVPKGEAGHRDRGRGGW